MWPPVEMSLTPLVYRVCSIIAGYCIISFVGHNWCLGTSVYSVVISVHTTVGSRTIEHPSLHCWSDLFAKLPFVEEIHWWEQLNSRHGCDMKELTEKAGKWDPQGCHPEGTSSASMSKLLVIYGKTKWMSYLPSENTGGTYCLVLQPPQESAQKLRPDVFSCHRRLVMKQHLTPLHLLQLFYGNGNNPYALVCRKVEMADPSATYISYSFCSWLPQCLHKMGFVFYIHSYKSRKGMMNTGSHLQHARCFFPSAVLQGSVLLCCLLWVSHSCGNLSWPSLFPCWSLASLCHFWIQFPAEAALVERQNGLCYSCISPGEALAGVLACTFGFTPAQGGVKNSPTQLLYTAPWGVWQSRLFPPTDAFFSPEANVIGRS